MAYSTPHYTIINDTGHPAMCRCGSLLFQKWHEFMVCIACGVLGPRMRNPVILRVYESLKGVRQSEACRTAKR